VVLTLLTVQEGAVEQVLMVVMVSLVLVLEGQDGLMIIAQVQM
jgi:hypothetical protein